LIAGARILLILEYNKEMPDFSRKVLKVSKHIALLSFCSYNINKTEKSFIDLFLVLFERRIGSGSKAGLFT